MMPNCLFQKSNIWRIHMTSTSCVIEKPLQNNFKAEKMSGPPYTFLAGPAGGMAHWIRYFLYDIGNECAKYQGRRQVRMLCYVRQMT